MLTLSIATEEVRCVQGDATLAPRRTSPTPIIIVIWPSHVWRFATTGLRFGTRVIRQASAATGRMIRAVHRALRTQVTIKVHVTAGFEIARCI